MLKWIETTGRSEEDAIAAALFQLGLDRDDVSVEVIERAKSWSGSSSFFLGFFLPRFFFSSSIRRWRSRRASSLRRFSSAFSSASRLAAASRAAS